MALKSTIFKAELQVADMDRAYYGDHALTIARHPSEQDARMMVRVLAFALHASPALAFAQGLTASDEPDLWRRDATGTIECWIDVGQPDERLVRRACGRAEQVVVYAFGRATDVWWARSSPALARLGNLAVWRIAPHVTDALAALAQRTMRLQCTVQDGQVWFGNRDTVVELTLERLRPA